MPQIKTVCLFPFYLSLLVYTSLCLYVPNTVCGVVCGSVWGVGVRVVVWGVWGDVGGACVCEYV